MPLPERALIDTSAFYAVTSSTDRFHMEAKRAYERLVDHVEELWTTSYVLTETIALMHHRLGRDTARAFVDGVSAVVRILWVGRRIHREAWHHFSGAQGAGLGFVDWTTAIAARRLQAPVFTFDDGFARQGVATVPV